MSKVKGIASNLGSIFAGIGKGAAYAGGALLAVGTGAGFAAFKLAEIAEEGEAAERRLNAIVKSMGLFEGGTSKVTKRLSELADETARITGIDDDSILATQAKLMTFRRLAVTADQVGGAFDRANAAALDMAAAGFGTAETNAAQLGRALQDPIKGLGGLTKSGITFTQVEKDKVRALVESNQMLKAQEMILRAIETQVGGTAEATAKGSARMGVAFSQMAEKLGAPVSDMLSQMADGLIKQMPNISAAITQAIRGDIAIITQAGVVIGEGLMAGMKTVFSQLGQELVNSPGLVGAVAPGAGLVGKFAQSQGYTQPAPMADTMRMNSGGLVEAIERLNDNLPGGNQYAAREETHRQESLRLQRQMVDELIRQGKNPSVKFDR